MATKTISIMEDAYRLLANLKRGEESFSDVIRREFSGKGSITEGAGIWSSMTDKEHSRMEEARAKAKIITRRRILEDLR